MTITFEIIVFLVFEELRLIKAHHVICMKVRKKQTDLMFSPLKRSIETPRNSDIRPANVDIIIGKRRYEQWVNEMRIEDTFL